jgi:hypothetical protein
MHAPLLFESASFSRSLQALVKRKQGKRKIRNERKIERKKV